MRQLFERVVRPLATPETPGALFGGLRLMAVDGILLDVPDTPSLVVSPAVSSTLGGRNYH